MNAPLGPAGLAWLIVASLGVLAFLLAWGDRRAAQLSDRPDGEPLTATEQATIDRLEEQFQEPQ